MLCEAGQDVEGCVSQTACPPTCPITERAYEGAEEHGGGVAGDEEVSYLCNRPPVVVVQPVHVRALHATGPGCFGLLRLWTALRDRLCLKPVAGDHKGVDGEIIPRERGEFGDVLRFHSHS